MLEEKYMDYDIEMNKKDYQREKEARAKRLEAYAEAIQTITLQKSSKVIEELIEERRRQGLTQQDLADMTGILAPNLARLQRQMCIRDRNCVMEQKRRKRKADLFPSEEM